MRNRRDVVASVLLIAAGIGIIIESIHLKVGDPLAPQPGFFPFLAGAFLVGLSIVLFVQSYLGRGNALRQPLEAFGTWHRPAILVVSMGVYTVLMEPVGYVLPTIMLAAVVLRILGVKSWMVVGLVSFVLSVGTYVLFGKILGIDLPPGILSFVG